MSGATVVEPLTTRDTVARDTPARRATFSSVGRGRAVAMALPSPSIGGAASSRHASSKRYLARSGTRRAARRDNPLVPMGTVLRGAPLVDVSAQVNPGA